MTVQQNSTSHEVLPEGLTNAIKYKGYYYCKVLEGRGWFVLNSAGESIHETTYQHEAKDYITKMVEKEQQEAEDLENSQEISKEKTIEERTDEANECFDSLNQEQLWDLLESVEEVKEIQIINRFFQSERAYIYQIRAFDEVFDSLFFWQSGDEIKITAEGVNSGIKISSTHKNVVQGFKDFVYTQGDEYKTQVISEINDLKF